MSKRERTSAEPPTHNPNAADALFDHEKLEVYREAISFCAWAGELIEKLPRMAARDQLDRASTSFPLNIAEGNAKFSPADRSRFFEIVRGSAVECASCMDVLVARRTVEAISVRPAKEQPAAITRMLVGLLKRFSARAADFLREDEPAYTTEHDYDGSR